MAKRLVWPDLLKGFLIITVILGHAISYVLIERGEDFLSSYLWLLIYSFHMPAFMAASGYFAYKNNKVVNGVNKQIKKRFHQLIIPFITWSIIMFIVNHNVTNPSEYVLYPNNSYWFLWALFFITSIFSSIQYIANRININTDMTILLTAIILIAIQMLLPDPKIFGYEYVSYYFIYYSMGYFVHKYNKYIPSKTIILCTLTIIWFVLGSFWKSKGIPEIIPASLHSIPMLNIFYRITTATIFIIAMFGFALKYENSVNVSKNQRLKRILLECGQISLGLYTAHKIIIIWLVKGIVMLLPNIPDYIYITIAFILLTALSIMIVRYISKWKITSYWLLGKK